MAIAAITSAGAVAIASGTQLVTWASAANGDTGAVVELHEFDDVTFGVSGTFGTGGSATLEGSNDGTNFAALTNQAGTTIAKTAAGFAQVAERPRYVRPHVTAGDGTTALVATIVARRRTR